MTDTEKKQATITLAEKVMGWRQASHLIEFGPSAFIANGHGIITFYGSFNPWTNPANAVMMLEKLRANTGVHSICIMAHAGGYQISRANNLLSESPDFCEAVCLAALEVSK